MSFQKHPGDGIRILSLDSGGPGTYSQALILEEIEEIVKKLDKVVDDASSLIRDHFDLIGGVGFGGLLAILLGRLGMTATQAKDGLLKVAQAVFPPDATVEVTPDERSKLLRSSIESIVRENGLAVDAKLYDRDTGKPRCITVVFAASSDDDRHAHALRTYGLSKSSLDPTIVEAACATISIPPFFAPVTVGPPMLGLSFIGGPKDGMNPASNLFEQAETLFGVRKNSSALISIGCGRPAFKHQSGPSNLSKQKRRYESVGSGSFLDILSPVKMALGAIEKRKARKAQSSKAVTCTSMAAAEPNAGWDAVHRMADNCVATSQEVASQLTGSVLYLRLDVTETSMALNLDDWTSLGTIAEHTRAYLEKLKPGADIRRLLEKPKGERGGLTSAPVTETKKPSKSVPKAPPRVSSVFVRREAAYAIMKHHLVDNPIASQKIMVISGMGGCGKTQLVSYFLRESVNLYSHVIYVDASSEQSIKTDLEAWIQSIKGHEGDDWQDALTHIRHTLRNEPWVLVLDNADDIKVELSPYFPDCNRGTILVTSRNRDRGALVTTTHVELGIMSPDEAMAALVRSADRQTPLSTEEEANARNLLVELGHLPLAISLAGAYCRQLSSNADNPYTFGQYLDTFRVERSRLMDRHQVNSVDRYKRSVSATIALSYDHLSDLEQKYFELFATFDGTDISLEIFSEAAKARFEDRKRWMERQREHEEVLERLRGLFLRDGKWKNVEIETAVGNLASNSLLSTTSVAGTIHIHIHPLVQLWARGGCDSIQSSQCTLMAAQVLTACDDDGKPQLGRAMLPHIQLLETMGKISGFHINCRIAFITTLKNRGYYDIAAQYCKSAYEEIQFGLGSDDLATLGVAAVLADIHYCQGQYKEAEKLQIIIWEKQKEMLGVDDMETVSAADSLGKTYRYLGHYSDALGLQQEVWGKRKEVLGVDHPDTLTSANNLANTYRDLGRHKEVLELNQEVWEKRKEVLGVDHPDTLTSASNLAITYRDLGRHKEALELKQEVWEKRKEVLGVDHPGTLSSASNLAITYRDLGRHKEALELNQEVWEKRKEVLGVDHPDTLASASNLAITYRDLGRHKEALELNQEVWEKLKEVLGVDHPDTLTSASNLASTYRDLGRHKEALELNQEVWEKRKEVLGVDHPDTLTSANNLANTYSDLSRHKEALELNQEVWEKRKEVLGVDHPDTLTSASNLAITYRDLGRHKEALELNQEVWEKLKEVLGEDHPDTLTSASNLAITYGDLGRHEEALELNQEVWEKRKKVLGVDHPDTLTSAGNLAITYCKLGRYEEAQQLQQDA